MDKVYAKVLDRMRTLCSKREYCVSDIRTKASAAFAKAFPELGQEDVTGLTDKVIESLVEDKYLDDARYAAAYARDKASIAGWGRVKIGRYLAAKGVGRETVSLALSQIEDDVSYEKLCRVLSVKLRTLKGDPQCRFKLLRFALSRGYVYDEASKAVSDLLAE